MRKIDFPSVYPRPRRSVRRGLRPLIPRGSVQQPNTHPSDGMTHLGEGPDRLDDDHYPAYSMGSAARILDTTAAFLRSLDEARLLTPQRSEGGHRRYSRYQLRIAARARELVDQGMALEAACRIIILEDQLAEAHALNAALQQRIDDSTVDEDRRT